GGRPTDIHLSLGVFSGSAPGQARGVYDIAKNNAGKPQEVSGLGEVAFWDNSPRTLRAVKGNHMVDLTIGSDLGGLKTAQAFAAKPLAKLPELDPGKYRTVPALPTACASHVLEVVVRGIGAFARSSSESEFSPAPVDSAPGRTGLPVRPGAIQAP